MFYSEEKKAVEAHLFSTGETLNLIRDELWWQKAGYQETATGYGVKLTSPYKTFYNGRYRRVYYSCFSNVAHHFIVVSGKELSIH